MTMKLTLVQSNTLDVRAYPDVPNLLDHRLSTIDKAIEACQTAGDRLVFADELAKGRINDRCKDSPLWGQWYTGSAIYTGRAKPSNVSIGKGGTPVVVVTHIPTKLSTDPAYIRQQIEEGRLAGPGKPAVPIPNAYLHEYLTQEGEGVHVIGYDNLCQAKSGIISVWDAHRHPLVVPFLGGRETVNMYLSAHEERYKRDYNASNQIYSLPSGNKISVLHTNDLSDDLEVTMGRLLVFGNLNGSALDASSDSCRARVLGTATKSWQETQSAAHAALDYMKRNLY